jgi:branched-chain amino acid transport system substrate-binding protein
MIILKILLNFPFMFRTLLKILSLVSSILFAQSIGILLPLSGPLANIGENSRKGILLAQKKWDPQKSFSLHFSDSQGTAQGATLATKNLIHMKKVSLIVGDFISSSTLAASVITEKTLTPMISPGSTAKDLTNHKHYLFRVCFEDTYQGKVLSEFASSDLKLKSIVTLGEEGSDFSQGIIQSFKDHFPGKILSNLKFPSGSSEFKTLLSKIYQLKPDAVLLPAYYPEVGRILNQAYALGLKIPFLGVDGWESPQLFTLAGKGAEGHYLSTHFHKNLPSALEFTKDFQKTYSEDPSVIAALSYDSMMVAYTSLSEKKSQKKDPFSNSFSLRNRIASGSYLGVSGEFQFDQKGNANKSAVILKTSISGYSLVKEIKDTLTGSGEGS